MTTRRRAVSRATKAELRSSPELASLEVAASAASVTVRAMRAVFEDLESKRHFFISSADSERGVLAAAVISAAEIFSSAISRYRSHVKKLNDDDFEIDF